MRKQNKINLFKVAFITLVLLMNVSLASIATAETNLVASWNFNEGAGTVAYDSSGNGNNANLINGPVWINGIGKALQFDGTNDYIVKTSAIGIPAKSPLTIALWVKAKSFSNPKWNDLFRKEGSWAIQADTSGMLNFEITSKVDTVSTVAIPANTWTHVAVTFEGTTIKFYKNGVLGDTKTQTIIPNTGLNTIDIGGYTSWGTYLNGALDEIKIYNRALSAAEIRANYLNSGTTTPAPTPVPTQSTPTPTLTPAPTKTPIPQSTPGPTPTLGKLLFDGTFKPMTIKLGSGLGFNSLWTGWYCLPQPDSLVIVSAPGGRPGYAAKFTNRPGHAYDCGGNQHNQISYDAVTIPNPNRDVWYGWSQMLDPSWKPPGSWMLGSWSSTSKFYDSSGSQGANTGLNLQYGSTNNHITLLVNRDWTSILPNHELGVWYDWMFHIKYARDNTGFLEVYLKKPGQSAYTKLYSKTNFQTEYPWVTPGTNYYMPRLGIYRSSTSTSTQIMYFYNPKIGTSRESVEYRN